MVPCHICHICRIWRSRGGGVLRSSFGGCNASHKSENSILMVKEGWGSHYM